MYHHVLNRYLDIYYDEFASSVITSLPELKPQVRRTRTRFAASAVFVQRDEEKGFRRRRAAASAAVHFAKIGSLFSLLSRRRSLRLDSDANTDTDRGNFAGRVNRSPDIN